MTSVFQHIAAVITVFAFLVVAYYMGLWAAVLASGDGDEDAEVRMSGALSFMSIPFLVSLVWLVAIIARCIRGPQ
jgi:hypothetical protein